MRTLARYLAVLALGCSLGLLWSLGSLRTQCTRTLQFIGGNPPNRQHHGLKPLHGSPAEIKAELELLPGNGKAGTQEEDVDILYIREALSWISGDFRERIRLLRSNAVFVGSVGFFLFWAGLSLRRKANQNGAANRSEPVGPQTTGTPSAAGSGG